MRLSRLGTDSSLPPDYQGFRAASELGRSILAAGQPSSCRPTTDRGCKAAPFKEPPLTAESGGATRAALLAMRAHRGTGSSNPLPSSRQSVSRGISPSCIERPAVAAAWAGPARRHGRERRAGLVNITPIAGNVSVGPYSSTAVPARRFTTVVALVRPSEVGLAI